MANIIKNTIIIRLERYENNLNNAETFWQLNTVYCNFMTFIHEIKTQISDDKELYNLMIKCLEVFELRLNSLPKPTFIK